MRYKATIVIGGSRISKEFPTISAAAQWLDSENNNLDATTIIETFDESGKKTDGFYYTEKIR
jgi:hypothetical protein